MNKEIVIFIKYRLFLTFDRAASYNVLDKGKILYEQ